MVFKYGVKIVWPGGSDRDVKIGFSSRKWEPTITIGTRMLIYETETSELDPTALGRMAIIGEVEVTGDFYRDELGSPSPQHTWLVPVKPIGVFPSEQTVARADIRRIMSDRNFPQHHDTWRELREAQYLEITRLLHA